MNKYFFLLLFIFGLAALSARAQSGVRFGDGQPIWSASRVAGPILSVPNSKIQICYAPNVGVPCTNLAPTYTDDTLGFLCPSNMQVVLAGTSTCQATTDQYGNWGVWLSNSPTQYTWTVTTTGGQSFGPFPFTVSSGGGGGGSITLQTNGTNNPSQTLLNFMDANVFTWSNTVGGGISVNFTSQPANMFLASPNGGAGVPTARTIVAADIPTGNACGANNFATGLGAALTLACNQPSFANLTGSLLLSQTVLTTNGDLLTVSSRAFARLAAAGSLDTFLQGASLAPPTWGSWVNCGDATHALGYSTTTHNLFCQLLSGGGGGGGVTLQTNGSSNTSQTTLNFQNAGVFVWSNPSTGNEQVNFASQAANTFLAAPNGSAGLPSPRLIVAADIPAGTSCGANLFSTGLNAALASICTQPAFSNLSGKITLAQTVLTTNGDLLTVSGGLLARIAAPASQDFILQGANAAVPSWLGVNNCGDGSHALSYSTGSHTFGCQAITAGTGTINNCLQYCGAYYSAAGTTNTISGISPPTTPNIAFLWCSTPSGGVATAPAWCEPGVPINAQTGATYTFLNTDRESVVAASNSGAQAYTLPQAGTTGFDKSFNFALCNNNTGLVTITPTTSTILGKATALIPNKWCGFFYSDNTNYSAGGIFPSAGSFSDVHVIPFANCIAGTAGGGVNSANFTAACRAGSNNLGGEDQAIPSTGGSLQFMIELPVDWDTTQQPYINVYFGSGANTSGTVIWTASSACVDVSTNGAVSDDPSFNAESAFTTRTMASANKMWYTGGQFTAITSGNGCKALSPILIKLAVSGTAGSNINAYQAVVTIPTQPTVQAN